MPDFAALLIWTYELNINGTPGMISYSDPKKGQLVNIIEPNTYL